MEGLKVSKIYITSEHVKEEQPGAGTENTDVIVVLDDGSKYTASFFTYAFIEHTRMVNKLTGENLGGKYFWAKNMVLIEDCSAELIKPVVKAIIDEGEFNDVFRKL